MRVGIMQPYLFPYIGYFQLIRAVDQWVVFDHAQYMRHGWVNRNRILHPQAGPKYIIVPLAKHSFSTAINRLKIKTEQPWAERIIGQLQNAYQKRAPNYQPVMELVSDCLSNAGDDLCALLTRGLQAVCDRLQIDFDPIMASELGIDPESVAHPGQWALRISENLGARTYINPVGGRELFKADEFEASGVKLKFLETHPISYQQADDRFHENLSIIDVMMWNSGSNIEKLLGEFELKAAIQ